jgi:hypothetical protein
MPTKKKTTKKYDLSRSAIVDRLEEILETLRNIDTSESSPNAVSCNIDDVVADLEQFQNEVTDEAY